MWILLIESSQWRQRQMGMADCTREMIRKDLQKSLALPHQNWTENTNLHLKESSPTIYNSLLIITLHHPTN